MPAHPADEVGRGQTGDHRTLDGGICSPSTTGAMDDVMETSPETDGGRQGDAQTPDKGRSCRQASERTAVGAKT